MSIDLVRTDNVANVDLNNTLYLPRFQLSSGPLQFYIHVGKDRDGMGRKVIK
jgi:hypothetical protein